MSVPFKRHFCDSHPPFTTIGAGKITFPSLTFGGRHRKYSTLRLEYVLDGKSRGIYDGSCWYLGQGELESIISNYFDTLRKCRKVGPRCCSCLSRTCFFIDEFQKTARAEKRFESRTKFGPFEAFGGSSFNTIPLFDTELTILEVRDTDSL